MIPHPFPQKTFLTEVVTAAAASGSSFPEVHTSTLVSLLTVAGAGRCRDIPCAGTRAAVCPVSRFCRSFALCQNIRRGFARLHRHGQWPPCLGGGNVTWMCLGDMGSGQPHGCSSWRRAQMQPSSSHQCQLMELLFSISAPRRVFVARPGRTCLILVLICALNLIKLIPPSQRESATASNLKDIGSELYQ